MNIQEKLMQTGWGCLILLLALGLGANSSAAAAQALPVSAFAMKLSEPTYPFCERPVVSPFLAPIEDLPALREPPKSGELPFAPSVHIQSIRGPLVARGGAIGFSVFSTRSVDLKVTGRISRITSSGRVKNVLRQTVSIVKPNKEIRIGMSPSALGIYRVDVRFERFDGTLLKTYKQYFRVAPPRLLIRLGLNNETVAPGAAMIVRLENPGTEVFSTSYGYWIERFTGSSWEVDPSMQDNRRRIKPLIRLLPGGSFDCWKLTVPNGQAAGQYRISKRILGSSGPFVMHEFTVSSLSD